MKSFAFFALLLLSANVLAQTPAEQIAKLQKDPNIIWIGEFYRDYEDLDNGYEGRNVDRYAPDILPDGSILHNHKQQTSILKLQRRNGATGYWQYYFWKQIIDPKTKIFADADLSKPISDKDRKNYVSFIDTIDSFNPETAKPVRQEVQYQLNPENIYAYSLRQLIYYNAKENMYYNLPLSIAPLKIEIDGNGKRTAMKPLFWLPVIASSTPINPDNAPSMPFIKSVQMHLSFADAKALKETKKNDAVNQIWIEQMAKQKDKIFAVSVNNPDDENNQQLLPQEIYNTLSNMDTVEVLDPETSVATQVVIKKFDIVGLRINQTFGWDDKKKTLTISTYSIAPIVNRYGDNGNVLTTASLFYLYPHRRFKTVPK